MNDSNRINGPSVLHPVRGTVIASMPVDALSFLPRCVSKKRKKENLVMKNFKQFIFVMAMVVGLAFSVSAQKDDQKQRPPKERPPRVDPKDKPPRGNPPKGDDKPKKPELSFYLVSKEKESDIA